MTASLIRLAPAHPSRGEATAKARKPRKGVTRAAQILLTLPGPPQPTNMLYLPRDSFSLQQLMWHRYVTADQLLLPGERLIASYLLHRANRADATCFPEKKTIASETGLTLRTVERGLVTLAQRGWITIESRVNSRVNLYTLTHDERLIERIDVLLDDLQLERERARTQRRPRDTRHG